MKPPIFLEKLLGSLFETHVAKHVARVSDLGFEKSRRAVAALSLSFFVTLYLMLSFNAPEGWGPAFLALSGCYVLAFIGVTAEWFWGRWFASGLGWSGVMVAALSLVLVGWTPPLVIYGALHGLIVLLLMGKRVSALYEMQDGWRQRMGMDEFGVARLRKTVTRAAASLPSLILWALAPKEPGQGMVHTGLLVLAALAGVAGLGGLLRLRAWGVLAVAASAIALVVHGIFHCAPELDPSLFAVGFQSVWGLSPGTVALPAMLGTLVPGVLLMAALVPVAGPLVRFLRRP
ncbi:MAG TPA: hypothetical protein VGP07_19955 [Polyangia bacterium]|jgi:hypothetical protein